ncbi:hypothetical protein Fmac_032828 [Flemingia macrophylla]|uniref:Uncharacterized protein n=1 Tax=Flemingia macrophylla TaxID=520843 RepID=A0ABD1L611_9FABA
MMPLLLEGFMMWLRDTFVETRKLEGKLDALVNLQSRVDEHPEAYALQTPIADHHGRVHDMATDTFAETRKLEGKLDALVNLVTQLAANQKPAFVARVYDISDHHTSKDRALDREDGSKLLAKLEGKLDALVNLVTQVAANQKPASVARVCGIRYSNDHHTRVCPSSQQSEFSARNDAIVIRGVHDVATDTFVETRKLEGKLDALVNLVTQLAANQKPASVARVCGIGSSNDHHTSVCPSSQQSRVDEHPEAYAANTYSRHHHTGLQIRSLPLLQESTTYVPPMTTILVYVLLRNNLEWMSILRLMLQTPIADHHTSKDRALDREDGSKLLAVQQARCSCELGNSSSCESKPAASLQEYAASVIPMTTILESALLRSNLKWMSNLRLMLQTPIADHHSSKDKALDREDGSQLLAKVGRQARCSCELGDSASCESKPALLQEFAASVLPMTTILVSVLLREQSRVDEHPEAYAANTYSETTTGVETRHLIEKMAPNS